MFNVNAITNFAKKHSKEIVTATSLIALTATSLVSFLQGKKCQKAEDKIKFDINEPDKYEKEVTKNEMKHLAPALIPTFVCAFSIGMLYGISERRERALTSALLLTQSRFNRFQNRVKAKDPSLYEEIQNEIANDAAKKGILTTDIERGEKVLCYDTIGEQFFYSTLPDLNRSAYLLNRYFKGFEQVDLNQAREIFGLPEVPWGWNIGWDEYIGEVHYGYRWIDVEFVDKVKDDGTPYVEVQFPFGPHPLSEEDIDEYDHLDWKPKFVEESNAVMAKDTL